MLKITTFTINLHNNNFITLQNGVDKFHYIDYFCCKIENFCSVNNNQRQQESRPFHGASMFIRNAAKFYNCRDQINILLTASVNLTLFPLGEFGS